jgi:type II secretory pathway component PulF
MASTASDDDSVFNLDDEIDGAGETLILTDLQAAQICDVFADGLDSGLSYERIFDMLDRHSLGGDIVEHLRDDLQNRGLRLSEAFRRHRLLDDTAHRLLTAAEFQGRLPATFEELSELYRQRQEDKRNVVYALVEPLIVIALVGIILIGSIIPNIQDLMFSQNVWAAVYDIGARALVKMAGYAAFWVGVFWVWLKLPVNMRLRQSARRFWTRIPFVSKAGRLQAVSLFCRYFQQSINSGLDVYRSMRLAARASNDGRLASGIEDAADKIKQGSSLTDALFDVKALPDEVIEQVDIGEESGRLAERLGNLADRFHEYADERFQLQMTVFNRFVRYGTLVLAIGWFFYSLLSQQSLMP